MPAVTADHVAYLSAGLALGASVLAILLAAGAATRSPAAERAPDVAAVAIAGLLAYRTQVPWAAAALVAAIAAADCWRPRQAILPVVGAAGLALTARGPWSAVALAGAAALLLVRLRPGPASPPHPAAGLAVCACLAATAMGAPDTEAPIAALGALGPLVVFTSWRRLAPFGPAAAALVAWIAVDSYRGRPAGLTAALVALASLVLVTGLLRHGAGRRAALAWWALGAMASAAAARTIGLESEVTAWAIGAAGAWAAVVSAILVRAVRGETRGARTSPA